MAETKFFSLHELSGHNISEDCWVAIKGKVYDVTSFLAEHPGGDEVLLQVAGKDATQDFEDVGHSDTAKKQMKDFLIGLVEGTSKGEVLEEEEEAPRVPVQPRSDENGFLHIFLKFILPLFVLGLAFVLRFFGKKDEAS